MLLQEFVIESIRPFKQLYDLSDEDYKDNYEKINILQKIAENFNSRVDVVNPDGTRTRPNLKGTLLNLSFTLFVLQNTGANCDSNICKLGFSLLLRCMS